jgi:hypothetical protein
LRLPAGPAEIGLDGELSWRRFTGGGIEGAGLVPVMRGGAALPLALGERAVLVPGLSLGLDLRRTTFAAPSETPAANLPRLELGAGVGLCAGSTR